MLGDVVVLEDNGQVKEVLACPLILKQVYNATVVVPMENNQVGTLQCNLMFIGRDCDGNEEFRMV